MPQDPRQQIPVGPHPVDPAREPARRPAASPPPSAQAPRRSPSPASRRSTATPPTHSPRPSPPESAAPPVAACVLGVAGKLLVARSKFVPRDPTPKRCRRPVCGCQSFDGSSAYNRTSIACPTVGGRLGREPVPGGDRELQLHQVEAGRLLGDGVFDLEAGVHLQEVERARPRRRGTRPCRRRRTRSRPPPSAPRRTARRASTGCVRPAATAPPRRPSGGGAGSSTRVRRPPRSCRADRPSSAPRCAARSPGTARRTPSRRRTPTTPRPTPPRSRPADPPAARPPASRARRRPPTPSPAPAGRPRTPPPASSSAQHRHAGRRHQLLRLDLRPHRRDRVRPAARSRSARPSITACANPAFSDRNPYPGCTASAPALNAASIDQFGRADRSRRACSRADAPPRPPQPTYGASRVGSRVDRDGRQPERTGGPEDPPAISPRLATSTERMIMSRITS